MSWVILLRGVNVGGARKFLPSALAKDLAEFEVENLGAAGTFVAHAEVSEARLRRAIADRLPFETEVLICPGSEVLDLLRVDPFGPVAAGSKACLSVLVASATLAPRLPLYVPDEPAWEAKVIAARGRYVLSVYRRLSARIVYPNPVVERAFGVGATTRGWATVVALGERLAPTGSAGRRPRVPSTKPRPRHGGK